MTANPVLLTLCAVLIGLLFLSLGVRRQRSSVVPLQRTVEELRRLALANPDRYTPALAQILRLLSIELLESGQKALALTTTMESVDLYRALSQKYPGRYEADLAESFDLESALKDALGLAPETDLHAKAWLEYRALQPFTLWDRLAVFYWSTALIVWLFSVGVFAWITIQPYLAGA